MITNTIIVPIIRSDFIGKMLETLYKNTEPETFRVIVIDQTGKTEAYEKYRHLAHLWITSYRNLGFSRAMNTGILLSQTPYITLANDDLEFLDKRWWDGIVETFATDEKIIAVNPMSPREGGWGYGLTTENNDSWVPPNEFIRDPDDEKSVLPNFPGRNVTKELFQTEEGYSLLLNEYPRYKPGTVVDAITTWCTVFKKTGLEEIGLLDEKYYPGNGEDYDLDCRAYSCGYPEPREKCDPSFHRRMVSTSRSWVFHFWSKSKEAGTFTPPPASRPNWNNGDELWSPSLQVWGHYDDPITGEKKPVIRREPVFIDEL